MCGIVGVIGNQEVTPLLMEGLRRLEYRGYDSAGIASLYDGSIHRRRAEGKLANLQTLLAEQPLAGTIGIGHTRWATHGAPTEVNAHPHATEKVAVVHNGIIENFRDLRAELEADGHEFTSATDSEVVVHLITGFLAEGMTPEDAATAAIGRLEGAFALGIIFGGDHDLLIGARRGSPLVVGYGDGEMYIASDALALAPLTDRICYLDEGDRALLTHDAAAIFDADGTPVEREVKLTALSGALIDKGNHRHYMAKEIFEQPAVIGDTLGSYVDPLSRSITLPDMAFDLAAVEQISIIACGTSYYAGLVAKYWFEKYAGVRVDVDIASEFRYREVTMAKGGLALFISQSGETADTLAALRDARAQEQHIAAIVNVPESSIARESDVVFPTHAGPEIGVASTKAFTCQLTVLACLAVAHGKARGTLSVDEAARLSGLLTEIPAFVAEALRQDKEYAAIGHDLARARDVLYLGRGTCFPLAMEGALKLKEISYIHAEGYPAGELKHGPIALIDEAMPVIVLAPRNGLFEKTASNMQEVIARGGKVILFSDRAGVDSEGDEVTASVVMPDADDLITPILYAVPVQLLAYHTAVAKGTDVDQPRNLAKSVTVE